MSHKPWTARLNRASISAAETGLKATHFRFVLALDEAARGKPFCWPSNQKLAEQLGVSEATIQRWSLEVEAQGGWICRVLTDRKRPDRIGFLMLRRLSDGTPACRTVEDCHRVAAQLRDNWMRATNASGPVPIKILGALPGERTQQPTTAESRTRENPRENEAPAPQEQGARHLRIEASGTSGLRPEELRIKKDEPKEQQGKPLPDSMDSQTGELPPDAAEAVARVRAAAEASKPNEATPLAAATERMARAGHDPDRLEELARESLRKDRPVAYFLAAVRARAADEDPVSRLLRGVPKPPPKPKGQTVELTAEDIAFFASAKSGCGVGRKVGGVAR